MLYTGDGFSRRAEDSILHGCIPVIIMDDVDEKFSTVVDYSKFSVRIAEKDVAKARHGPFCESAPVWPCAFASKRTTSSASSAASRVCSVCDAQACMTLCAQSAASVSCIG